MTRCKCRYDRGILGGKVENTRSRRLIAGYVRNNATNEFHRKHLPTNISYEYSDDELIGSIDALVSIFCNDNRSQDLKATERRQVVCEISVYSTMNESD